MLFGWLTLGVLGLPEPKLWLTVDSDDLRHLPRHQGHPTRSKHPIREDCLGPGPSPELEIGMKAFAEWHLAEPQFRPTTLFVIGDQLQSTIFKEWLRDLISRSPTLTVGCHGWSHRSWSAWGPDPEGFATSLRRARAAIESLVGPAWRPWFRAPAGYIAPWMAEVLASEGFTLDTSVNPSVLVRRKAGPEKNWDSVVDAITRAGLIEREWLTSSFGPACGPALHIPGLAGLARRQWLRYSTLPMADDSNIEDSEAEVFTVYWHLLDHARKGGKWEPPLGSMHNESDNITQQTAKRRGSDGV